MPVPSAPPVPLSCLQVPAEAALLALSGCSIPDAGGVGGGLKKDIFGFCVRAQCKRLHQPGRGLLRPEIQAKYYYYLYYY